MSSRTKYSGIESTGYGLVCAQAPSRNAQLDELGRDPFEAAADTFRFRPQVRQITSRRGRELMDAAPSKSCVSPAHARRRR